MCEIIFGLVNFVYRDTETFNTLNFIILLGKWYINTCKSAEKELLMSPFLNVVRNKLKILKINFGLNAKQALYENRYAKLDLNLL